MQYIAYAQRGELEKCAEESFDCVSCGCCSVRCPAEISHPMVGTAGETSDRQIHCSGSKASDETCGRNS